MFPRLEKEGVEVFDRSVIESIFSDSAFRVFDEINVPP